jgi:hypothetical protein
MSALFPIANNDPTWPDFSDVPFNSFAEYAPEPNPQTGKNDVAWFGLNDDRPVAAPATASHPSKLGTLPLAALLRRLCNLVLQMAGLIVAAELTQ